MNRIVEILMRRDGCSEEEVIDRINEVKNRMEECNYDPSESEEIFVSELGIEPDYIFDLLLE